MAAAALAELFPAGAAIHSRRLLRCVALIVLVAASVDTTVAAQTTTSNGTTPAATWTNPSQGPTAAVRICHLPVRYISNDRVYARHAMFATVYLAPRFPRLNVSFDFATLAGDGGTTIEAVARGMLSERAQACDAIVGPQWSSVSASVAPLINVPWVSHTATSTALSDKSLFPWFSRVLPTDDFAGAGMAAIVRGFGWTHASVMCVDDSYGGSVRSGFAAAFREAGGVIDQQQCFLADSSLEEVASAVAYFQNRSTKVIAVAAASSRPSLSLMVDEIVRRGMHRTHVFIFSESACATGWARLRDLPGVLCVSYTTNAASADPYEAAWAAHDPAMFDGLEALGVPPLDDPMEIGLYSHLIHDAVLLQLSAADAHVAAGGNIRDRHAVLARLRETVVPSGSTGVLRVDAQGNRKGAVIVLQNVEPNATDAKGFTIRTFARWTEADGVMPTRDLSEDPLYWRATSHGDAPDMNPPAPQRRETVADYLPSPTLMTTLLGIVVVSVIALLLLLKMGCADSAVLRRLLHSGVGSRFLLLLFDLVDLVLGIVVAVDMLNYDHLSETFRTVMLAAAVVGIAGGFLNVFVIAAFIRAYIADDGQMPPATLVQWKLRLASSAMISFVTSDLPLAVLLFASLALSDRGDYLVSIAMALNSIMCGIKLDELTILPVILQPKPEQLQRHIVEEHAENVPLVMESPDDASAAVLRTIEKESAPRFVLLGDTARHIVVQMREAGITDDEFFAVIWRFMGEMYQHVEDVDAVADLFIARRRGTLNDQHGSPDENGDGSGDAFANINPLAGVTIGYEDGDGARSRHEAGQSACAGAPILVTSATIFSRHGDSMGDRANSLEERAGATGDSEGHGGSSASPPASTSTVAHLTVSNAAANGRFVRVARIASRSGRLLRADTVMSPSMGPLFDESFAGSRDVRIVNGEVVFQDEADALPRSTVTLQSSTAEKSGFTADSGNLGRTVSTSDDTGAHGASSSQQRHSAATSSTDAVEPSPDRAGSLRRQATLTGMFVQADPNRFQRSGPLPMGTSPSATPSPSPLAPLQTAAPSQGAANMDDERGLLSGPVNASQPGSSLRDQSASVMIVTTRPGAEEEAMEEPSASDSVMAAPVEQQPEVSHAHQHQRDEQQHQPYQQVAHVNTRVSGVMGATGGYSDGGGFVQLAEASGAAQRAPAVDFDVPVQGNDSDCEAPEEPECAHPTSLPPLADLM